MEEVTAPAASGKWGGHRGGQTGRSTTLTNEVTEAHTMASIEISKSKSGKTHHGRIVCTLDEGAELYGRLQSIAQRQQDEKPARAWPIRTVFTTERAVGECVLSFTNFTSSREVSGLLTGKG